MSMKSNEVAQLPLSSPGIDTTVERITSFIVCVMQINENDFNERSKRNKCNIEEFPYMRCT